MAVRIVTDSASDISQAAAKQLNVQVIPLRVRFDNEEYLDGVTLEPAGFFEKLAAAKEAPKTSQIPPFQYSEIFNEAAKEGDQVLCFTMSSGVSGCYQSACTAALDFPDTVKVIDTQQFCISQYIIVERAVRLRDAGYGFEEIYNIITKELKHAHVIASFDTLEYLRLGGRLSAAAAFTGNLLAIKPVLTIEEGQVKILSKARGSHRANALLNEFIEKAGGIDWNMPVCLGFTGSDDSQLKKYLSSASAVYAGHEECLKTAAVGATIGTYAGPGAIAAAFFDCKKDND